MTKIEIPYENNPDCRDELTVGRLKEMIQALPDDYIISFDNALGYVVVGDFTIYHNKKRISING